MDVKRTLLLPAAFIGFAVAAFAQIDGTGFAADLRAKYGPPLAREIFIVPAGEMVVDYAANGHVCRIQLPPFASDFVLKLVPLSMRGKELRRMQETMSLYSASFVEYENVTIAESSQGQERTKVTVTFAGEKCRDQPSPSFPDQLPPHGR